MSDDKKKDPWIDYAIMIIGAIVAYFLLGYAFGDTIAYIWWSYQGFKLDIVGLILSTDGVIKLTDILQQERNWKETTFIQSWDLANYVGGYWRWIVFPGLVYWAWEIAKKNPIHKLRNKHTMNTLIKSEVVIWPHIQPIVGLNLISEPTNKGEWASAKNPMEFAKENRLLKEGTELDKEKAAKVFATQLSNVWVDVNHLDPITKAFCVIFAAQGNWNEKDPKYKTGKSDARKGINVLAKSFFLDPKNMDTSWVDEMAKKHMNHPDVVEVIAGHGYTHTVLMSLLEYARKNGVFPSSEFFWLRPVDRQLWYALNNVGRNVAWTEVAGIYGHWLAEKVNDAPLLNPYVQKSVEALSDALKNIKLKPKRKTEENK